MTQQKKQQPEWLKLVKKNNPMHALEQLYVRVSNQQRRGKEPLDYVMLSVPDDMTALPEPRGFIRRQVLGEPPLSLWELDSRLRRIADDPRPKGVILYLRGLSRSLADLQTLRDSIAHVRDKGKKVICYAQDYDLARYFVASAADEIIMQPGGNVFTVGLRQEAVFFKDALERIGVSVDSIAISPYKGAADSFTRSDISDEGREQLEWLLDSRFDLLVNGIAQGRGFEPEKVREIIDNAPYLGEFAKGIAVVDALLYEEELYTYLETASILIWEQADKLLLLKERKHQEKYIAILPIEGLIFPGESTNPPSDLPIPVPIVQDGRAGDITIVQQVRALMQDENLGAVVLYVDSGGGAASAAEAMRSALAELAQKVPLVVYMNGVAASGGYMVACPGRYIVAQPGTITGSIGVLASKPVSGDLREKLSIRAVEFLRGRNADILSLSKPFSDEQRQWMRESIERTYDQFVEHVARSRKMETEAVDAVGGGRVWTGAQALEHGLVDELGGLRTALDRAREFASLPEDTPVALVTDKGKPLAPQVAEKVNPAAHIAYVQENAKMVLNAQAQLIMPLGIE